MISLVRSLSLCTEETDELNLHTGRYGRPFGQMVSAQGEDLPGPLEKNGTKEKYRREHEPVLGNVSIRFV